jgi:CYTH domain-containing protein
MEPLQGGEAVFKLGQKLVPSPPDFSVTTITNIYLTPSEYALLAPLPALELLKRRYRVEEDGRIFSVDVFEQHLSGLVLAEIGFDTTEEMRQPFSFPPWVAREVSNDIRFTGGALVGLEADEVAALLRSRA